jgi:aspartyl/asparaginyl beta-hydroxylase (cupin superfamily)
MNDITVHARDIFQFGNQLKLNKHINVKRLLEDLKQFDDKWAQYNEFKPHIKRQGLCVINESGINGSGPAINSLLEWNRKHGTTLHENDFTVKTPVYEACIDLQDILDDELFPHCFRTHFLKIPPGGYFPPHRDNMRIDQNTLRLIIPLSNTEAPWFRFMIDNESLNWENGSLYAVNTTLGHQLFNTGTKDSIWLIINAHVNEDIYNYVTSNLSIT